MHVFCSTCKAINNTRILNETFCAVWASAHEVTVLVVWLKTVILLNRKDSDEKPHHKTSKLGVQCAKTEINLSVWCTPMLHLFMHKFLSSTQDSNYSYKVVYSVKTVKADSINVFECRLSGVRMKYEYSAR